jgi:CRP-like cAMP-binding protein
MAEKTSRSYRKDALIYIESDEESDEVFIVESGEVTLTGTPGIPHFRSTLSKGDIFGFTSCLCRRPRMETAMARTDCSCAAIPRERFLESVQSNPELAGRIISYFAQELRAYDDLMTSGAEAGAVDEQAHLWSMAQYLAEKGNPAHALHVVGVYVKRFPTAMHAVEAQGMTVALKKKGAALPALTQKGIFRVYPEGAMLFCEHEQGEELYIIKSGKVEIRKIAPPEEILLSILREGDIFGELSIVTAAARNATAVTIGETLLLPVSRASLPSVFQKSPATVGRILTALSQRLWFTFIRLRSKVYANPITRTYVLLENKLLEERVSLSGTKPFTLALGIGEILGMVGIPADQVEGVKTILADDDNLAFQFHQVTVESPRALEAKTKFYCLRDHLGGPQVKAATIKKVQEQIGLNVGDLRVPTDQIPE